MIEKLMPEERRQKLISLITSDELARDKKLDVLERLKVPENNVEAREKEFRDYKVMEGKNKDISEEEPKDKDTIEDAGEEEPKDKEEPKEETIKEVDVEEEPKEEFKIPELSYSENENGNFIIIDNKFKIPESNSSPVLGSVLTVSNASGDKEGDVRHTFIILIN
jgi:transposase